MRSSRIVYYLLLALIGISGCVSTDRRYYSALASSATAPIARVIPLTANPTIITTEISPQIPANIETPRNLETVAPPPMPRPQPAPFVVKSDRSDNREKSAPTIARAATVPPPPNDNRLLELLEKDIDKAVEQPRERRRLQFSKDVVEHPRVRQFISQYSIGNKNYFQTLLARSGKYMPIIAKVLSEEGLPEEL